MMAGSTVTTLRSHQTRSRLGVSPSWPMRGSANAWSEVSRGVEVGRLIAHTTCAAARPTDSLEAALFAVRSAYAVEGTWADAAVSVEPLLAVTAER